MRSTVHVLAEAVRKNEAPLRARFVASTEPSESFRFINTLCSFGIVPASDPGGRG
jgi:hypothetical protein